MVDLHRGIDAMATVLVEVLASFLASPNQDTNVIYIETKMLVFRDFSYHKKSKERLTMESNPSGTEKLSVSASCGNSG